MSLAKLPCLGAVSALLLAGVALGACSSSVGGGSSPPRSSTVIVQPGQQAVCANGSAPPC